MRARQFQATWPGDSLFAEASSTIVSLTVTKLPSILTCNASASTITISDNVTLRGEVLPIRPGIDVTLQYQTESGWSDIQSVVTDTQGQYKFLWTPSAGGTYQIRAICSEDDTYSAAVSTIQSISVEKLAVTITCTVLPVNVEIGNSYVPGLASDPQVVPYKVRSIALEDTDGVATIVPDYNVVPLVTIEIHPARRIWAWASGIYGKWFSRSQRIIYVEFIGC